jgi:hypothetical protein
MRCRAAAHIAGLLHPAQQVGQPARGEDQRAQQFLGRHRVRRPLHAQRRQHGIGRILEPMPREGPVDLAEDDIVQMQDTADHRLAGAIDIGNRAAPPGHADTDEIPRRRIVRAVLVGRSPGVGSPGGRSPGHAHSAILLSGTRLVSQARWTCKSRPRSILFLERFSAACWIFALARHRTIRADETTGGRE